jgi:hypothetical protein
LLTALRELSRANVSARLRAGKPGEKIRWR